MNSTFLFRYTTHTARSMTSQFPVESCNSFRQSRQGVNGKCGCMEAFENMSVHFYGVPFEVGHAGSCRVTAASSSSAETSSSAAFSSAASPAVRRGSRVWTRAGGPLCFVQHDYPCEMKRRFRGILQVIWLSSVSKCTLPFSIRVTVAYRLWFLLVALPMITLSPGR